MREEKDGKRDKERMRMDLKVKRAAAFVLAFVIGFGGRTERVWAKPAWPSDTGIMAEAGIVIDMDSGTVLFGQNIHETYAPASITKLLTALIVAENVSLDEMVTFSRDAVYDVEAGSGNALSLEEGDVLSVRDCLYALLLRSSNQAANALAEHVAGSRDAFAEMMNRKLEELGCTESHFANPSGLNSTQQYVTAYDMAKIGRAAFANETVLQISSSRRYTMAATIHNPDGLTISMEHRILAASSDPSSEYYLEGAVAGKTGYTSIAGNTQVLYAVRDGRGVLAVILRGSQPQYYFDGKTLVQFGFASFKNLNIAEHETFLGEIQELSADGAVYPVSELSLDADAVVTLPLDAEFADAVRNLVTEVPEGSPKRAVALLEYTYDDRKIGSAWIYGPEPEEKETQPETETAAEVSTAAEKTETKESAPEPEEKPEKEGSSGWLWALAVVAVLALIAGGAFAVWSHQKKEKEEQARRRQRRLQRLKEMGCSEEEFDKLVREHKERRQSGPKEKQR